jgi:hypothetical protein
MIAAGRIFAPEKIRGFMGYAARRPLCLAGLVIALMLGISSRTDHLSQKTVFRKRSAATASGEGRKVYPLSVIHGGAYSAEELNRARQLDSVVGAHYADFGRSPVVQHTPANLFMYVSYRKSDKVYWTRTKRRIPKGESVLSDGKNLARTRCGNRLSFTPQQPLRACRKITFTIWEASTDQSVDGGSSSTPGSAGVAEDSESSFVPC